MTTQTPLLLSHHAFDVNRMAVIGQRTPDGTIYAGVSPDTDRPMYTTPKDTGLCATWSQAKCHAEKLNAHGRKDWRVPTTGELAVLSKNRAAIGNFDETGHIDTGWYWSSTRYGRHYSAWMQRFMDGAQYINVMDVPVALRCVCG